MEESLKRRGVEELLKTIQESGNGRLVKEIYDWQEKKIKKAKEGTQVDADNSHNMPSKSSHASIFSRLEQGYESQTQPLVDSASYEMFESANKIILAWLVRVLVLIALSLFLYLRFYPAESTMVPTIASTTPPKMQSPILPGIFVATYSGLIALNLQTSEVRHITKEVAYSVAVNDKLKKVYWSEGGSLIMRANFDGSARDVIHPQTCDRVYMLAIDEPSGNVYYGQSSSNKTIMCNALGKNCAVIISDTFVIVSPNSIAMDSKNRVIYLSGAEPSSGYICANMDGRNATRIYGRFSRLRSIALDKSSNDILYWIDAGKKTIGSIDVNGRNKRTLVSLDYETIPYHIQVDDQNIYFGTRYQGVQSANKYTGEDLKKVLNFPGIVFDLALYSANA